MRETEAERGRERQRERERLFPARSADKERGVVGWVPQLHNWCLHRSMVNTTTQPRRAFSVCYIDSETRQRAAPELSGLHFWPQIFPDFRPVVEAHEAGGSKL